MKNSHEKSSDEQDQSLESHHYMTKIVSELVISDNQDGLREEDHKILELSVLKYLFLHSIIHILLP